MPLELIAPKFSFAHRSRSFLVVRHLIDEATQACVTKEKTMTARMKNPAVLLPETFPAIQTLIKAAHSAGVPRELMELVHLRVSQLNGCSACVDSGARSARKAGMSDDRLFAVAAWRETPYFSEAERAALELSEAATRLSDRADPVPDAIWNAAAKHFDEKQLAALVLWIATTNLFNRINATVRTPAPQNWG
jgi:AhpD family alkylhydroperoxidase